LATSAAVVTVVAVMLTLTLKGGRVFASNNATATVTAARSVADGRIDDDDPTAAVRADNAASSMLEKGKRNKNETEDIGTQAFDAILQLGMGCQLMV
jgi:hypothetical protein